MILPVFVIGALSRTKMDDFWEIFQTALNPHPPPHPSSNLVSALFVDHHTDRSVGITLI